MKDEVSFGATQRVVQSPCPQCGHRLDALTVVTLNEPPSSDLTPTKNSFSICLYCATILRFEAVNRLRKATPDDLVEIMADDPKLFDLLQDLVRGAQWRISNARRRKSGSN
jgi:hypothetical protein